MKKTDCAYFAGIFDGEGTVSLAYTQISTPKQRKTYFLRVSVANTNEWLIQQLRFTFGGQVFCEKRKEDKWKDAWRWTASKNIAQNFLIATLPYLQLKRPQAELALQFLKHKTRGGRKTDEYLDIESDFKQLLTGMNRRGKVQISNKPLKMERRPKLFD